MSDKVQSFFDAIKNVAERTGEAASHAADLAGRKTTELAGTARLNLKLFDLSTECDTLYKEIGKMVYGMHQGTDLSHEELDRQFEELDKKQQQIAELQDKIASMKNLVVCPKCGHRCGRKEAYCAACGMPLNEDAITLIE